MQAILDACSMIIAELGLRKSSSYTAIADILAEAGLLNSLEASRLKDMARIRNRVAHTYRRLNPDELQVHKSEWRVQRGKGIGATCMDIRRNSLSIYL